MRTGLYREYDGRLVQVLGEASSGTGLPMVIFTYYHEELPSTFKLWKKVFPPITRKLHYISKVDFEGTLEYNGQIVKRFTEVKNEN